MKKVIKIKESKVLEIIDSIINEQSTPSGGQTISVSATNQLGTYPQFDGLKTLAKDLKSNVEKALRGSTPYRIKNDDPNGVAIARIQGSALKLIITLVPCKQEERDWYFDLSLAIYSEINTDGFKILSARVMEKAAQRGQAFVGAQGKIESLGRNHIQLDQLPNLDPKNPNKTFNLYVIYIAGARPSGYQRAELETGDGQQQDVIKKGEETKQTPITPEKSTEKKQLNEVISSGYTASDCDELHAFQSTKKEVNGKKVSKIIGNMNVIVGERLQELYKQGYNPRVMSVAVEVNGMNVKWTCTIKESPDGKAWVGFTSRGAGCNNDVKNRAESSAHGNDVASAKKRIMDTYSEEDIDIQKADEVNYTGKDEENIKNSFRQIFYVYTKPGSFHPRYIKN